MKINILIILLLFSSKLLLAQSSILKGEAIEYAGLEIPVYTNSDFISEKKVHVGTIAFNTKGEFNAFIKLPYTKVCFAQFDLYQAMIYIEPGKSYNIQFPPKKEATVAQIRNPFFKPIPVWFKINNQSADDINSKIKDFELTYRKLEDQHFNEIFVKKSKVSVDQIKNELASQFPRTENSFFEDYKRYRLANLDFALNNGKSPEFLRRYFGQASPKLEIPSYCNLFNQVFSNYFGFLASSIHGQQIKNHVNNGQLSAIEKYLCTENSWNNDFCRLLILKSLKDAYYSGAFSKKSILDMLSNIQSGGWQNKYKLIASNLFEKITYLTSGTNAPSLSLKQNSGQTLNLDDFKGKWIYLHFTDLSNPICKQHMDVLSKISEKYSRHLVCINVLSSKTPAQDLKQWKGIFTTTNEKALNDYKVKTYPTAYLIGRNGKLVESPALNPLNGFESKFHRTLEKERIQKLRMQK